MFYAHFVLAKKGPLARIWLAAHWDKKLTKAHVFETNIESSVEGILQPKVKMALRTSGHLLLGIVRIYSRKAKYLLADCNEAFIKIKMAFRPGMVDLPEGNREAAVSTITLPEVFHDFDAVIPDITIDMDAQVTLNQSRAEDITMKEDYGTLSLITDDGFEDMGFDETDAGRDATSMEDGFDHTSLLLCEDQVKGISNDAAQSSSTSIAKSSVSLDVPLKDDGFGGTVGEGLLDGETGGLFEPAGLFDDAPLDHVTLENNSSELHGENSKELQENKPEEHENSDQDMYDMGPGSIDPPSPPSSPGSPGLRLNTGIDLTESGADVTNANAASSLDFVDTQPPPNSSRSGADNPQDMPPLPVASLSELDHTTLINNEDESFALAPLDATISQGLEKSIKAKRKRKLIVDEVKNISGEEMKAQLSDTTDIVTTLDLAPPTKRLMHWKETGGVEKLFALPGHTILSRSLSKAYQRHLTTRSVDNEEFGFEDDHIDLDDEAEQGREDEIMVSRKRRRECDSVLPQDLSHLDNLHLDSSRPSYTTDHTLSHPSLDVPSFLQPPQHHLFPSISTQQMPDQSQQQIMSNVMSSVLSHPPPPAHMIHQMMQSDVNQLSHLSQMMHHQMVDPAPPHHSMATNIHNVQSPIVSEAYNQSVHHSVMEPVSQHLISDGISPMPEHMQHHAIEKQMPNHSSFQNQMTQHVQQSQQVLQEQLSRTVVNHMPCVENALHPCNDSHILQPPIDTHTLNNTIDDEMTQPLLDDQYTQSHDERKLSSLPSAVSLDMSLCDAPNPTAFDDRINNNQGNQIQQTIPEPMCSAEKNTNPALNIQQPGSNLCSSANSGEIQAPENKSNNAETVQNKTNELPVSDDDDYGAPSSVGPTLPEEQMADETYEQFEERMLTKRTTHMLHVIQNSMEKNQSVSFAELVKNNKRKQVAQKFYTFLVLKKQQAVELEQNSTFGDMIISKGPKFNAVYNAN